MLGGSPGNPGFPDIPRSLIDLDQRISERMTSYLEVTVETRRFRSWTPAFARARERLALGGGLRG